MTDRAQKTQTVLPLPTPQPPRLYAPSRKDWDAKGAELFGPDKEKWIFRCPLCGNEMSIARAKAEFPDLKGRGWHPESECIGRYIDVPAARHGKKPCNWCAYGLFSGPVHVEMEDGKSVAVFDFAGQPFTAKAREEGR